MNRLAGQVWNVYKNNGVVQDAMETLLGAGISATGQALFTDMSAEEIGTSALIGSALAMGARPIGAKVGQAIGGKLDEVAPNILKDAEPFIPVTRDGMAMTLKSMRRAEMPREATKGMQEILQAKRNQNAIRPDGTERGSAETVLGYYLRNRGDNIAQYGFAAVSPLMFGSAADEPEPNTLSM